MISRRQKESNHNCDLILSTQMPQEIEINLKGRSRIAVLSVKDLETYSYLLKTFAGAITHSMGISRYVFYNFFFFRLNRSKIDIRSYR